MRFLAKRAADQGVTMNALAVKTGCDHKNLSMTFSARNPEPKTIKRIARALGLEEKYDAFLLGKPLEEELVQWAEHNRDWSRARNEDMTAVLGQIGLQQLIPLLNLQNTFYELTVAVASRHPARHVESAGLGIL